jgi:hypothetical protein
VQAVVVQLAEQVAAAVAAALVQVEQEMRPQMLE